MSCIENGINEAEGRVYSDEEPGCYASDKGYDADDEGENSKAKGENGEDDSGCHVYDDEECCHCADSEGYDADDERDA